MKLLVKIKRIYEGMVMGRQTQVLTSEVSNCFQPGGSGCDEIAPKSGMGVLISKGNYLFLRLTSTIEDGGYTILFFQWLLKRRVAVFFNVLGFSN
jgi:hypothetical protein